eukprot:6174763-Pleurochrysis_carterae.AAC.1
MSFLTLASMLVSCASLRLTESHGVAECAVKAHVRANDHRSKKLSMLRAATSRMDTECGAAPATASADAACHMLCTRVTSSRTFCGTVVSSLLLAQLLGCAPQSLPCANAPETTQDGLA